MGVYIVGTLISMLFAGIAINISKSRSQSQYYTASFLYSRTIYRFFVFLSFLPLTIISAIRYNVGTDYMAYVRIYENTEKSDEFLFISLIRILRLISRNPIIFFVATSIIICGGYYIAIFRKSQNPVFSILLFIITWEYFRSMNTIRQYMALTIFLFSLSALEKGQWKKVSLTIVLAYMMHHSSIVLFALLILCQIQMKPYLMIIVTVTTALFLNFIVKIARPLVIRYLPRYAFYFSTGSRYSTAEFTNGLFLIYMSFFLLLIYLYYFRKKTNDKKMNILLNAIFLSLEFCIFSNVFPTTISRLTWYTDSIVVIYLPHILELIDEKYLRIVITFVLLAGYLALMAIGISRGDQSVVPYKTAWG